MTACDTIEALQVREPLPVTNFGTVFWSQSYISGKGLPGGYPDFQAFLNQPWTTHYSIPSYGGLTLDVKLAAPLRTDEGFENVDINVDYIMGTIERSYNRDWNRQAKVGDLSIPKSLIKCLEEILLKWHGKHLMIHYSLLPEEGDPLTITAEFRGCGKLRDNPDDTLRSIAQHLTEALAS